MAITPKTKVSNDPQKVLKSIDSKEEIKIIVNKKVDGKELRSTLTGIHEFSKVFNPDDKYMLEIKVTKLIEEVCGNGKDKLQPNKEDLRISQGDRQ